MSLIVGWLVGVLAACGVIVVLWALGWWPHDNNVSFLAGMALGGGGGLLGIYIATELD